jgi:hypothetical protein
MAKHDIPVLKKEDELMPETSIYICENTDCVLDPIEQMTYALNETEVSYGSVVILKNAP